MNNVSTLTSDDLVWLKKLISQNNIHPFYIWRKWINTRNFVLKQDKHECQNCKAKGRYKRAVLVHHVKHIKQYPQYALMMWIEENGVEVRQLISLCDDCHSLEHPERLKKYKTKKPVTVERWD